MPDYIPRNPRQSKQPKTYSQIGFNYDEPEASGDMYHEIDREQRQRQKGIIDLQRDNSDIFLKEQEEIIEEVEPEVHAQQFHSKISNMRNFLMNKRCWERYIARNSDRKLCERRM